MKAELAIHLTGASTELWNQLAAAVPEVWLSFRELLHHDDPKIRLRSTTWFLDRVLSVVSPQELIASDPRLDAPLPASLSAIVEAVAPLGEES